MTRGEPMTRGDLVMVDTNILLSASNSNRTDHEASHRVFLKALEAGVHLATCGQILREYLVVATRPMQVNGLGLSLEDALTNLDWFRKRQVYLEEPESVHQNLVRLIEKHNITGKRIHDLNIVALMNQFNIHTLLTNNAADFEIIPDIEIMDAQAFSTV